MISLDSGDKVRGDASAATVVDYTIYGLDNNAIKQLADGQLASSIGDLYTADSADVVTTIILVNTDSSARTVNLYLTPSGGSARRLIPKDTSLGVGYSLHFDGAKVSILNPTGGTVTSYASHATSHTDGTDDIQDAAADDSTKGIATFEADDFDASSGKIDLAASATKASTTDSGTATPTAHDLGIKGGEGIDTSGAGTDVTIAGEDASTTNKGIVELATTAETTTGTDTGRAITPDGLAGSNLGKRIVYIKVLANDTALTTGDGKAYVTIPSELNGMNLVDADAAVYTVSSSGTPTIQIHNLTDTVDMLSTRITIDANEKSSYTAATPPVIDTANDDVATGDIIRVDVDVAGTDTAGLDVILSFQTP